MTALSPDTWETAIAVGWRAIRDRVETRRDLGFISRTAPVRPPDAGGPSLATRPTPHDTELDTSRLE